ncbi:helix-turn-helix transcriptional regulator [Mesorhizobium comanense]|uniref:helix-turn-helix transcriptional regulator n=1 Tax=Mesorhizobium comanense TaxID=2502215 RepID=UPI0010F82BAE|nr:autoinducer binding domain-containing protein [Mesorhizobium comanense]
MRTAAGQGFLDFCAAESDVGKVMERFVEAIGVFGFTASAGGAWAGAGGTRSHRFYFNNWPKDWFESYMENGFMEIDPMILEARRRMTPFLWTEMVDARTFTLEGAVVTAAAKAYGWAEVMGIPIHGPSSYQGLVSLASLKPVTMTAAERALVRAMAVAVHDKAYESVGFGLSNRSPVLLTLREADCMRWVAAGKTDAEIGIILGIAPATVHYHVENVKKKAGTRSRSEAVALLTLAGSV